MVRKAVISNRGSERTRSKKNQFLFDNDESELYFKEREGEEGEGE